MPYSKTVNIACAIDNSYVQHCAVMLNSLQANNSDLSFKIFIINNGLTNDNQSKLVKFLNGLGLEPSLISIDESILENAPLSQHVSLATYFRLLIPQVIDSSVEKLLFLDSDIVVRKSIAPFWNIDISKYGHAAVENHCIGSRYKQNLNIPESSSYFNAGVLLINLRAWRELGVMQDTIEFINQYADKITFWDQDALNYVLHNRWLSVHSQWNAQASFFNLSSLESLGVTMEEYQQTRYDPAIVHFTGGGICKPWYYGCTHPFKQDYHKYLSKTPWRNSKLIGEPSLLRRIKTKAKSLIKRNMQFR